MVATPVTAEPWTARRIVTRSLEILREEGLRGYWFKLLAEHCYRRLLILERPLCEAIPAFSARIPVEYGVLEPAELGGYLEFHDDDPREQLEGRFRLDEVCFVARHEGRIVCANWAAFGSHYIRYIDFDLPIATDEVYLYDSYTDPAFRGKGLAPALAIHILEHYQGTAVRRALTAIVPENRANLRARAKSGYRVCGRMGFVRLGPWRRSFHRASP